MRLGPAVSSAALSCLLASCAAPDGPANVDDDRSVRIDDLVGRYAALGRFSGAVLVAHDGEVVFEGGYGFADRERGRRNDPETPFALASLTKQFTAAAILELEAQGKLRVEDRVADHLPDYPAPQGERVTIHHLLTHSSGVPGPGRLGDGLEHISPTAEPVSTEQLLSVFRDRDLLFEPGQRYRYSNGGYQLLGAIVEQVSGQPYADFLEQELFQPLGMRFTGCRAPQNRARSYHGLPGRVAEAPFEHPSWSLGDGCGFSSVRDLFLWETALSGEELLPAAQRDKLFAPHVERERGGHYGYGWFLGEMHGRPVAYHGGTTQGGVVQMLRFPEERLTIIALANYLPELGVDAPSAIAEQIAALCLGLAVDLPPRPVAVERQELETSAGRYVLDDNRLLDVLLVDDGLWIEGEALSVFDFGQLEDLSIFERAGALAVDALRQAASGRFTEVHSLLCDTLREAVTVADLEAEWVEFLSGRGKLVETDPSGSERYPGEALLKQIVRLGFESGEEVFVLLELTSESEICGWYSMDRAEYGIRSELARPQRVPLVPLGDGVFLADGFNYRESDVRLEFAGAGLHLRGQVEHTGHSP